MELSKQVVSLDLAKQLKELGFEQKSLFCWYHFTSEDKENGIKDKWKIASGSPTNNELSAYTVAELGEMLPFSVNIHGKLCSLEGYKAEDGKWESWLECDMTIIGSVFSAETEADARAKLLIDLKTNKLI